MRVGFLRIFDLYLWRHSALEMRKKNCHQKMFEPGSWKDLYCNFYIQLPPPLVYISSNNCSTLLVWVSFQFIPWYQISFNILINIFEFLCFNQTPETINRNVFILVDVDVQFETENLSFNLICVKIIQGVPNLRDRLWFPKMWSAFVVISYLP